MKFKKIPLSQGKYALVDIEDYEKLSTYKWTAFKDGTTYYAIRRINKTFIWMHREILNVPKGTDTDHLNHNGLDNRRCNIRMCTRTENLQHRRYGRINKLYSRYKGVCMDKRDSIWVANIQVNGKFMYIGRFQTEIEAAKAYDAAAIKYFGEFAYLNFPEYKDFFETRKAKVNN